MPKRTIVEVGGLWESPSFEIEHGRQYSMDGLSQGDPLCKHCYDKETITHTRTDKTTYTEDVFRCPRVVVASNEGGHNSTGVCLDCIIEAAAQLDQGTDL